MGKFWSKSSPAPAPQPAKPVVAKKWRDDGYPAWDVQANRDLEKKIMETCTIIRQRQGVNKLRILLLGPTGAGKSSLVNNINAAISGEYATMANVSSDEKQVTRSYDEYDISRDSLHNDYVLPVKICDFRGFGSRKHGASLADTKKAIEGRLKDGQKIGGELEHSDNYASDGGSGAVAQMLLIVVDITEVDYIKDKGYFEVMLDVKEMALEKGISIAVFLTKCDSHDSQVQGDLSYMHRSESIKKSVDAISKIFGVTPNRIFPVKNYVDEMHVTPPMAFQSLYALKFILQDINAQLKKGAR